MQITRNEVTRHEVHEVSTQEQAEIAGGTTPTSLGFTIGSAIRSFLSGMDGVDMLGALACGA